MRLFKIEMTWYLLPILCLWMSCIGPKRIVNKDEPYELDCPQAVNNRTSRFNPSENVVTDPILIENYSPNSLIIANAYGIIEELSSLEMIKLKLKERPSDSLFLARLLLEKDLDRVLDLAFLEIESYENFIGCNALNLVRVKAGLGEKNNKDRNAYTNAAIYVGLAGAAIVTGMLVTDNPKILEGSASDWIGVAGAVVAAGLAISSERVDRRVQLHFKKNLIEPIWSGDREEEVFSDSYWYLLNQDYEKDDATTTIRQSIIDVWKREQALLGNPKNMERLPVLLQNDGIYNEEMVQLRIDLIEEVIHGIDLIARALYTLNFEMD